VRNPRSRAVRRTMNFPGGGLPVFQTTNLLRFSLEA
jgi:hypothetical protein